MSKICAAGPDGTEAARMHRGAAAAEIHRKYPRRVIPPRWHDKWNDKGADYDNGLNDPSAPKNTTRSPGGSFEDFMARTSQSSVVLHRRHRRQTFLLLYNVWPPSKQKHGLATRSPLSHRDCGISGKNIFLPRHLLAASLEKTQTS